ncbi:MAG: hypothetical protein JWM85_2333 [Acidimicrobiaceae bacterium]|nr:hypothetical protein [Acidimicrobiaceae bacterium]
MEEVANPTETLETLEAIPAVEELLDRLAAVDLRVRELQETAELRDTELSAMERDLGLKERYIAYLELERHLGTVELGQVRDRAAELFGDLERAESEIRRLQDHLGEIQSQPSYRVSVILVRVLRRSGPLYSLLRWAARLARTH